MDIVNKHAPLKKKFIRGNKAPYTKKIYQNKFYKNPTKEKQKQMSYPQEKRYITI